MDTPPAPPGWNKTFADLDAEMSAGLRKSIGFPETEWARDYELSLLPKHTRFPRKGDVYEPLEPVTLSFLTAWSAPYTGSGTMVLQPGQQIRLDDAPGIARPILVYAVAVNYKKVERQALPWWTRWRPDYQGFYFAVETALLNSKFRLVQGEPPSA